jgi:hypothetical protein
MSVMANRHITKDQCEHDCIVTDAVCSNCTTALSTQSWQYNGVQPAKKHDAENGKGINCQRALRKKGVNQELNVSNTTVHDTLQ